MAWRISSADSGATLPAASACSTVSLIWASVKPQAVPNATAALTRSRAISCKRSRQITSAPLQTAMPPPESFFSTPSASSSP
jgi:hypothetical protein